MAAPEYQTTGFTILELLIVILVFGILTTATFPTIARTVTHARVNQAALVVGHDLGVAVSAAARQRKPVRLAVGADRRSLQVTDRASGAVLQTRALGPEAEYRLDSVSFSANPIDVFPNGFTSSALTVTLWARDYSRRVTLSRAGWVRVR
jgi:prepilin-type N-terminal cleavage/methylation domain-containing protein